MGAANKDGRSVWPQGCRAGQGKDQADWDRAGGGKNGRRQERAAHEKKDGRPRHKSPPRLKPPLPAAEEYYDITCRFTSSPMQTLASINADRLTAPHQAMTTPSPKISAVGAKITGPDERPDFSRRITN